jgi:ABC-type branched-subunit amino acid transport system ATPase component
MSDMLVVDGVTKRFAGLQALDGVSLEVPKGEVLGLIGPNGSGKTTLLNVISGVVRSDGGRVRVGGTDVTNRRADLIAKAGVARTFQNVRLFHSLPVRDNIALGLVVIKPPDVDGEVDALAARLGVAEWLETSAGALPYGIQRRVEIARALATRPAFLLLDEPAAGLNEDESDELLTVITSVVADDAHGCGVVIIDHDLRLIMRLCDRIHVLNQGKTIAEGTPGEVRTNPAVIEAYLGRDAEATEMLHGSAS